MTPLSTLLLYGGVFIVGGLGFVVALILTSKAPDPTGPDHGRSSSGEEVDPIRSIGF